MNQKLLLNARQVGLTIKRLAHQIVENHLVLENTVLIGLQPRGVCVGNRIMEELKGIVAPEKIVYGKLDITFYRDDIRNNLHVANETDIPFSVEKKSVVLIDDVLWTGRSVRAALDALLDFGRPSNVELCALIDRRFSRQLPIEATYVGRSIDTYHSQKVKVCWKENSEQDEIILITE